MLQSKLNFVKPYYLLFLLVITLPFEIYLSLNAYPISSSYLLIGIATGIWLLSLVFSGRFKIFVGAEFLPLFILIIIIFLSLISAVDKLAGLILAVQICAYSILYLVTSNTINTEHRLHTLIQLLLVGSILNACLGIVQVVIGTIHPNWISQVFFQGAFASLSLGSRNIQRLGLDYSNLALSILSRGSSIEGAGNLFRAFGLFEGPTVYGWFTATTAVFSAGLWLGRPLRLSFYKRISFWSTLLSSIAVLLSWTRSAWLALALGLAFIIAFHRARTNIFLSARWWLFGFIGGSVIILIVSLGFLLPGTSIGKVILSAIGGEFAAGSNAGRIATMRTAISQLAQNPIIGVGYGNYPFFASHGYVTSASATLTTAHNTYLELGVELGLIGLLVFLWLLYTLFNGTRQIIRMEPGSFMNALGIALSATWLSLTVIFMFGGNIVHPKWMTLFWLIAGIEASARRISQK